MKTMAKAPFVGLLLCGFALGQEPPASAPLLHMALSLDVVYRAAEHTDPTPELEKLCDDIGPRLTGSMAQQSAARQVVEYMRTIGLQQVHTES